MKCILKLLVSAYTPESTLLIEERCLYCASNFGQEGKELTWEEARFRNMYSLWEEERRRSLGTDFWPRLWELKELCWTEESGLHFTNQINVANHSSSDLIKKLITFRVKFTFYMGWNKLIFPLGQGFWVLYFCYVLCWKLRVQKWIIRRVCLGELTTECGT